MGGDIEMHDPPAVVGQHEQHVQDLKSDRWHGEEVDRHHGLDVISRKVCDVWDGGFLAVDQEIR